MSDEVRVTSATGGQKGSKLARFDLIPAEALWKVAELYGKGAEKYDDHNWRRGYPWSLSLAALERHLYKVKAGEDYDNHEPDCPEGCKDHTEMPHLTCIVFHGLALLTFMEEQPEFDDRFKRP